MKKATQTTQSVKLANIQRKWHLIDVKGKTLGRVTPNISKLLQGKHKTTYVSYLDSGDYVVVVNAAHVTVTGDKRNSKIYTYYSGYPGGLKEIPFKRLIENNPKEVIRHAVSGMLPKNKLRDRRLARLFIFANEKHPYSNKFQA